MPQYKWLLLSQIFDTIAKGDIHETNQLEQGITPLIGCSFVNDGVEGFFDPEDFTLYKNAITLASDGSYPLTAFYHPYEFTAKDNVVICSIDKNTKLEEIYYLLSIINSQTWRFSYGRKCYYNKMLKTKFFLPANTEGHLDISYVRENVKTDLKALLPHKDVKSELNEKLLIKYKKFNVTELFHLKRGDFHSLTDLDPGLVQTVSRVSENNGVVGCYSPPDGAKTYQKGLITVSTVTGEAFVQLNPFIVTDNVVVCLPKDHLTTTTLYFIQLMINRNKWRYSYGRQCYKEKFAQTNLDLPINNTGKIDENVIEKLIKTASYWSVVEKHLDTKSIS